MRAIRILNIIAFIILLIGGLNWLLIGIFNYNLVNAICFSNMIATRIIYSLVGISALYLIFSSIYEKAVLFTRNVEK